MPITCIECGHADLVPKTVQLPGTVRGQTFTVEMEGLECPGCGYRTIEGARMPEYGRLLADKYRARHGLLTSDEIRRRRRRLELTQEQFATHLGVGIASIKRWEMGKIQDLRNNQLIVERTRPPVTIVGEAFGAPGRSAPNVTSTSTIFAQEAASDVSTTACPIVVRGTPSATEPGAEPSAAVQEYIEAVLGSGKRRFLSQQTGSGWTLFHFESQRQTVNPQLLWLASESEEFAYA